MHKKQYVQTLIINLRITQRAPSIHTSTRYSGPTTKSRAPDYQHSYNQFVRTTSQFER